MNEIPRTPSPDQPRSIVFIAYPEMGLLDLTGAQTVFWAASKAMTKRGLPGYERHTASLDGGLIQTAEGLAVETLRLSDFADQSIDTLIVPGAPNIRQAMNDSLELVAWLQAASANARRTASVCSGRLPAGAGGPARRSTRRHPLAAVRHAQARFPVD